MAPKLKSESELNTLEGAEHFAYDTSVPYHRLDETSIKAVMDRKNLPEIGRSLVTDIRNTQPHFAPQGSYVLGNIVGTYPSRLMRLLLQFASFGVQYLALLMLESPIFNPRLIEIWNNVSIPGVQHKRTKRGHRVTALCIEPSDIYFFEYRTVITLLRHTNLYKRVDGKWDSPRLREAAAQYGIGYRLVTDEHLGRYTVGNLSYLSKVYFDTYRAASDEILLFILDIVQNKRVVDCRDLYQLGIDGEAIRCFVARQLAYYPINEEDLTLDIAFLYATREDYLSHRAERERQGAVHPLSIRRRRPTTGEGFTWRARLWKVEDDDGSILRLSSKGLDDEFVTSQEADEHTNSGRWALDDSTAMRIYDLSAKQLREGMLLLALFSENRAEYIWPFGAKSRQPMSLSTVARIKRKLAKAQESGVDPLIVLARNHNGNRTSQTHGERPVWDRVLDEHFTTPNGLTVAAIIGPYRKGCSAAGASPVTEKTIRDRIHELKKYDVIVTRKGKHIAYRYRGHVPLDKVNLVSKGRLPGEVGHIDSTPFPNVTLNMFTGLPAARRSTWTVMRDSFNDESIESLLYYGAPSYKAIFRLIVNLVKRREKLPQYLVVDGGPEHIKEQWRTVLGSYGVVVLDRSGKQPHTGQPAETGFGTKTRELLRNLPGYRDDNDDYRALPKDFRPHSTALLTLADFRRRLESDCDIRRGFPSTKTGGESISQNAERLEFRKGSVWCDVKYTERFRWLMMPLVSNPSGKLTVQAGGYVEHERVTYADNKLMNVVGQKVLVHEDPDNIGHVFIFIDVGPIHEWVEAKSLWYEKLRFFTDDERDEYQEHRRRVGKSPQMQEALADGLTDWRNTPTGAEAYVTWSESRDISVPRDFLIEHKVLAPDGTNNVGPAAHARRSHAQAAPSRATQAADTEAQSATAKGNGTAGRNSDVSPASRPAAPTTPPPQLSSPPASPASVRVRKIRRLDDF
ncbi:Mu transposase C-terminal domain-containing protein [Paraburkholderia sp. 32]|uniref:Mu transposase C-terminal domain-containing protein n=1 Tax=Paraburkholderia sp. 32 TaxID=2991057 RepID=UPI003D192C5E